MVAPRYPIFIPSKGRADKILTSKMFLKDDVPFTAVVEPQERKAYVDALGEDSVLCLPKNDQGLVYSRNWIKDHSTAQGHERHWQFDDDIWEFIRVYKKFKIPVESNIALSVLEDFIDRYENVKLASFNSDFFLPMTGLYAKQWPPFYLNARCYTCFIVSNQVPNRWRYRFNEDTDMTLQILADGWCTILFNAFLIRTPATMTQDGGQTDIYEDDGRLQMARQLERVWPHVVETKRRFRRPQHVVKHLWRRFDTQLKLKPDVDLSKLPDVDNYGLKLKEKTPVKSPRLKALLDE